MDSFPEDAANTRVNFYGAALDSNEEDDEEEELHVDVTTEVRCFKWPLHTFIFRHNTLIVSFFFRE